MTDKLIKRQQEDSKLQEKINPEKERKKIRKRKKRKKKKEMKDLQRMERSYHKMQNQIILIVKW